MPERFTEAPLSLGTKVALSDRRTGELVPRNKYKRQTTRSVAYIYIVYKNDIRS